jgi:hypothetical protein
LTFLSGLAEIEAAIAPKDADQERPSVDYLTLPYVRGGSSTATVQPLQEFDPSSEAFREDKGLAFVTWYHQSPYDWKRSALCTKQDGQCLPCELNGNDLDEEGKAKSWWPKKRFYINFVVTEENGVPLDEPVVRAFHCSTSGQGILPDLLEWYKTNGPISQSVFILGRKGEKRETTYTLTPSLKSTPLDLTDFEPQDTKNGGLLTIPYERQAKFYQYVPAAAREVQAEQSRSASAIDW